MLLGWPLLAGGARPPTGPQRAGPALREALAALRGGDPDGAAKRFAAVARTHPLVADHATHLRVRALLESGRPDDAIAVAYAFDRDHSDSPLRTAVFRALGDAYQGVNDEISARDAWQNALAAGPDRGARAELRFALAESLERSGELARSLETHRALWRSHPKAASDAASSEALERLATRTGRRALGAGDWVARGESLYAARDNEAALDAYDRALAAGGLTKAERRAVRRQRAFTLFRLRRYPDATEAFASLGRDPETRFWLARCYARRGQIQRSIAAFEELGRARGSFALRSRYLAGTLLAGEGAAERAEAHFAAVARSSRSASQRAAARWRLGWTAYRTDRLEAARDHFARLAADVRDPIDRLRARYWRARARQELGEAEAEQELADLALEYPFTYYGTRATAGLGEGLPERPPPEALEPGRVSFEARDLERLRVLLEAGLSPEAVRETRALSRRARGLADRLEVAALYAEAGDLHRAQRAVLDASLERLARGPAPGREDLWWFAWPWAFSEPLAASAADAGVEPALVLAVMREESGYRPAVVSPVGARGLLQIMPDTGRRLAEGLGRVAFDPEELFRPETNIRFGAHYLAQLLARFDGNHAAAVASYNAGPNAVSRWLRERPAEPADEWIEAIPYDQTRTYVKRVLRSLHAYRVLY